MNYQTNWRSRDLLKAWNENNIAQVELMKGFRNKIQDMLQVPVKLGSYTDHSDSLHLYGLYYQNDGLEGQVERMKGYKDTGELIEKVGQMIENDGEASRFKKFFSKKAIMNNKDNPEFLSNLKEVWSSTNYKQKSMSLKNYLGDADEMKRLVAAQMDAEANGHGLNQSEDTLKKLGYDLTSFQYPESWNSWDPAFDVKPDITKLARVL